MSEKFDQTKVVDGNQMDLKNFLSHVTEAAKSSSSDYLAEIESGKSAICNFHVSLIVENNKVDGITNLKLNNTMGIEGLITESQTFGAVNVPAPLADLLFDMILNAYLPMWLASNNKITSETKLEDYRNVTTEQKVMFLTKMANEYKTITELNGLMKDILDVKKGEGGTIN
jgi:hypothetical protein